MLDKSKIIIYTKQIEVDIILHPNYINFLNFFYTNKISHSVVLPTSRLKRQQFFPGTFHGRVVSIYVSSVAKADGWTLNK